MRKHHNLEKIPAPKPIKYPTNGFESVLKDNHRHLEKKNGKIEDDNV